MSIYDAESPSGSFLKLEGGTTHQIRMFGEPIGFLKQFKPEDEPKQRFQSLCLWRNKEKRASEIKILEFGWEIQKRLKALVKDADWGDTSGYDVAIASTGDGLARKYEVIPKPKSPLTDAEKKMIEECKLELKAPGATTSDGAFVGTKDPDYDPYSDSD